MLTALLDHTAADQASETRRHAYNAAFEELGLTWHWDAATYARLQALGRDGVRTYLETEQSHLLRAYEADFLVHAIETTQARCFASMTSKRARPAPDAGWRSDTLGHAGGLGTPAATRHSAPAGA